MNSTATPTQILKSACRTPSGSQQSRRLERSTKLYPTSVRPRPFAYYPTPCPTLPYPTRDYSVYTLCSGKLPGALWALRSRYRCPLKGWEVQAQQRTTRKDTRIPSVLF